MAIAVLSVVLGLAAVNWVRGALIGAPTPSVGARTGGTGAPGAGGQPTRAAAQGTTPQPAVAQPTTAPAARGASTTPTVAVVGGIMPGGPAVPVTITTPGQQVALSFEGSAGQRVSLRRRADTLGGLTYVRLLRPDGEEIN